MAKRPWYAQSGLNSETKTNDTNPCRIWMAVRIKMSSKFKFEEVIVRSRFQQSFQLSKQLLHYTGKHMKKKITREYVNTITITQNFVYTSQFELGILDKISNKYEYSGTKTHTMTQSFVYTS